jgi:2-iminobutanoate/2-iminopropanoate deaminase
VGLAVPTLHKSPEPTGDQSRGPPMGITRTTTAAAAPSGFPFSLASTVDGVCFISGMPAVDRNGALVAGTLQAEADLAWRNVVSIADAAGFSAAEVVFVQCVLADIGDYAELNEWWRRQSPTPRTHPRGLRFKPERFRSARRSSSRRSSPVAADTAADGLRLWPASSQRARPRYTRFPSGSRVCATRSPHGWFSGGATTGAPAAASVSKVRSTSSTYTQ